MNGARSMQVVVRLATQNGSRPRIGFTLLCSGMLISRARCALLLEIDLLYCITTKAFPVFPVLSQLDESLHCGMHNRNIARHHQFHHPFSPTAVLTLRLGTHFATPAFRSFVPQALSSP